MQVNNDADFSYYSKKIPDPIVQEIVGTVDAEYTIGVFADDNHNIYSIGFRRYLGYGSMSRYIELSHEAEMHAIAVKTAESCGLRGSFNVQMRKDHEGYKIFEVNARISSTAYFRHCFGFQDVNWWIDLYEGEPISYVAVKQPFSKGVRIIGEEFQQ